MGVFRGLAGIKLSGSPKLYGKIRAIVMKGVKIIINPSMSFLEKYGWNKILSNLFNPVGLLDPVTWREARWTMTTPIKMNGSKKCKEKNRFNVGFPTENPPHNHSTIIFPRIGIAETKFVITVAPQNDICPHGRT